MKVKNYFFFLLTVGVVLFSVSRLQAATISPNIFTDPDLGADLNNCSLRYAIESINNGVTFAGGCQNFSTGSFGMDDTIVLQAGPYVLTITGNNEDMNATGDLDVIMKDIIIIGAGSDQTSIDASGISDKDRVLHLDTVTTASITGVTFKGGDVSALGQEGGGIFSFTQFLTLEDVQITGNKAGQGGGISVSCQPTILDSLIQGNMAITPPGSGNGGGVFIFFDPFCGTSHMASIDSSQILGNNAGTLGGGIDGSTAFTLTINNSTIDGNTAVNAGGIFAPYIGITNSTISRNEATGTGGGIVSGNYLFLTNSTVSTNTAGGSGGGIASSGGLKGSYNVTIAFNEAGTSGGGVVHDNTFQTDTRFPMTFFNTIIAKNSAPTGPDCFGNMGATGGFNLIGDVGAPTDCNGFVNGVMGDQVGSPGSPIDPLLLPLDFYGGSTETHALELNSQAVDRGNDVTGCEALDQALFLSTHDLGPPDNFMTGTIDFLDLTIDQRFFPRPIAIRDPNLAICDIGAFELQTFSFTLTKDDGLGGASVQVGGNFTYTMVLTNNGPGDATDVILNDPLPPQVDFVSLTTTQGTCTAVNDVVNCDLGDMPHGQMATVTVTVTAVAAGDAVNTATVTTSVGDFVDSVTTPIVSPVLTQGDNLFNCSLTHGGPAGGRALPAMFLFSLAAGLVYWHLRRRAPSR